MDHSRLEPSSSVQAQSKKWLDRNLTNPQFFATWTELPWTALDHSSKVSRVRVFFHCIGLLMGDIYLHGTKYTDRTVIISPRVGIQRCAVINVRWRHVSSGTWLRNNVEIATLCGVVQTEPIQSLTARLGLGPVGPNGWTGPYWAEPQTRSARTGGIIAVIAPIAWDDWSEVPHTRTLSNDCSGRELEYPPVQWDISRQHPGIWMWLETMRTAEAKWNHIFPLMVT